MKEKEEEEKEEEKEEDTTIRCDNCGKVIYKNEICSCQKEKDKWTT